MSQDLQLRGKLNAKLNENFEMNGWVVSVVGGTKKVPLQSRVLVSGYRSQNLNSFTFDCCFVHLFPLR